MISRTVPKRGLFPTIANAVSLKGMRKQCHHVYFKKGACETLSQPFVEGVRG